MKSNIDSAAGTTGAYVGGGVLKNTRVDVRKRPFDPNKPLAIVKNREDLKTFM
jgi:hypothetical protein